MSRRQADDANDVIMTHRVLIPIGCLQVRCWKCILRILATLWRLSLPHDWWITQQYEEEDEKRWRGDEAVKQERKGGD